MLEDDSPEATNGAIERRLRSARESAMRRSIADMSAELELDPGAINVYLSGERVMLRMPQGCEEAGFDEHHARRLSRQLELVADKLHERLTGSKPRRRRKRRGRGGGKRGVG